MVQSFLNLTSLNDNALANDDIIAENLTLCTHCADSTLVTTRNVCEIWLSFPLATFGIVTNLLALLVLHLQRRRWTTNLVLQALAVADTLVLVTIILLRSLRYVGWPAYMTAYHHVFRWVYPVTYWVRLVDTWLTVLLTVDRYVAVCHPLHAQRLCTRGRTYLTVFLITLLSLLFCLPRYFEYELVDDDVTDYRFQMTPHATGKVYTLVYRLGLFFIFMYVLPISLLVALNVRLLHTLRTSNKLYRSFSLQHQTSTFSTVSSYSTGENMSASSYSITATVVAVVIVFVVCNTAAMTSHLLWALQECFQSMSHLEYPRRYLANISNVLVTLNSAVNFIIYCLCSRNFRVDLCRLLTCRNPPCPICCCCACCCPASTHWSRDGTGRWRSSAYHSGGGSNGSSTRLSLTATTVYRYGDGSSSSKQTPRLSDDSIKLHAICNSNSATT